MRTQSLSGLQRLLLAVLLVLLVAFTRVVLGVHYLSDVLGDMAAGLAWLALCLTGVDTLPRRRLAHQISRSQK